MSNIPVRTHAIVSVRPREGRRKASAITTNIVVEKLRGTGNDLTTWSKTTTLFLYVDPRS